MLRALAGALSPVGRKQATPNAPKPALKCTQRALGVGQGCTKAPPCAEGCFGVRTPRAGSTLGQLSQAMLPASIPINPSGGALSIHAVPVCRITQQIFVLLCDIMLLFLEKKRAISPHSSPTPALPCGQKPRHMLESTQCEEGRKAGIMSAKNSLYLAFSSTPVSLNKIGPYFNFK